MREGLLLLISLGLSTFSQGIFLISATAQVTPDGTTNTTVDVSGNDFTINQGDRAGDNLFHSFGEFSVPTDGSAFFNNAVDIVNIFSRVTGGNISNIDGLLRANGSANLFLLNPAGIIFGEGARLDIGGSFLGTTANSFLFEDGEFSATDLDNPPLLTINAPIGLNFRDNPGEIGNRSFVQNSTGDFVGLEVTPGNSLTLVGGDINFEAGKATASGGKIELGGLSAAGTITLNDDGSLSFPEDVAKADITLSNAADVNVRGTGGGSIIINARNLSLKAGDSGSSRIRAGITADSTSADAQAGDITINATDNLNIDDSSIGNQVLSEALGDAGDVTITTGNLTLTNGGFVSASTFGQGNAGSVEITASDTITIDGENSQGFTSGAYSVVIPGAEGDTGGVTINTGSLALINGGQVNASTTGQGNVGSVKITASDTITFDGETSAGTPSGAYSAVDSGAVGNAGGVIITTGSLSLTNGGTVDASTSGQGNAGNISIAVSDRFTATNSFILSNVGDTDEAPAVGKVGNIEITAREIAFDNGAQIQAGAFSGATAEGSGNISLTATESISFSGTNTAIFSNNDPGSFGNASDTQLSAPTITIKDGALITSENFGQGDAGSIAIITGSLSLTDGGTVSTSTFGQGNGGSVEITASDTIIIDGESSDGFASRVFSAVGLGAVGDAGSVTINTGSLSLTNGGEVSTSILGQGNGGLVEITASDTIIIDGESSDGFASRVFSAVGLGAVGDAGSVTINTGSLSLTNGGEVSTSTLGQGNGGLVEITASDTIIIDGETSSRGFPSFVSTQVGSGAVGNAGDVIINSSSLSLTNGGEIETNTSGQGNGGLVDITASDTIIIDGEQSDGTPSNIFSGVRLGAVGNAGDVIINSDSLSLTNGAQIVTSTSGQGNAGLVNITASDTIIIDGEQSDGISSNILSGVILGAVGNAGDVTINTGSLSLTNGGVVSAETSGQGNAGSVKITASDTITIDGETLAGFPSGAISIVTLGAEGDAGRVTINTDSLSLTNGGLVSTSTGSEGNAGDVTVNARESITISGVTEDNRSGLFADAFVSSGNGGNVNVFTNQLTLDNGGTIEASNFDSFGVFDPGTGEPGNINIQANSLSLSNQARIDAATQSETGNRANINLQLTEDLILRNNSVISARAFEEANGGNLNIDTRFIIAFPSQFDGNDILASAERGQGGNINITAEALFGIEERPLNPLTNDINASSDFGLDGNVSIVTPDIKKIQTDIELPNNIVETERLGANACSGRISREASSFTVKGKGGLPPVPTEPFMADSLIPDRQPIKIDKENELNSLLEGEIEQQQRNPNYIPADVKPIKTSMGDIYPARGIIQTVDGKIVLTAYPTDNTNTPTPHKSANCTPPL